MSRSNTGPTITNPSTMFIEWDSENGCFKTYNKEKKETVKIQLPAKFYVLDELATIKGFSDKTQNGIWSNEIKDVTNQPLKVMSKDASGKLVVIAEGLYADIKAEITAAGGKYTRSLYAAMLDENEEYQMVNFQLKGAAFSGWLDFVNANKKAVLHDAIICNDFKKEKKGVTKYTIPVFTSEPASEEGNEAAIKIDVDLQEYLKEYFKKSQAQTEYVEDAGTSSQDTDNILPFDDEDNEGFPFK